mmetsp:Transcript_70791/g.148136  ORF Transcript_70791/g.148136 Transcript_70791/m.148136 type:complete len:121 (+) Transcript_70791:77-439(+)|eukprot:CAMPEP_0206571472 /NCGR_PEP_ID=MMETSP0325_2-20121206/27665_1 /ASSEMBLY_ACC=CAM_ASM_000347 /TAXON_ID=2866 /ORGANISM="Crypthecodinium cohnii, Strain Seligo" /LENGTH=120 /DNA_ID=CAMNT_0054075481 /DNA_START=28 /DNA_END=390 /DNA_ORIENTATION=-
MVCYKDLAHAPLPSGTIRASVQIRQRNAGSVPDLKKLDPAFVAGTARDAAVKHEEVIRRGAEMHAKRCGSGVPPLIQSHSHLEESRWIRRLHPSNSGPCALSFGVPSSSSSLDQQGVQRR